LLPAHLVDPLIAKLRANNSPGDGAAEPDTVEAAVLETAVAHHHSAPPHNIFAPFHLRATHHSPDHVPLTHWANVDSGSMVNIVYQGVIDAFPELRAFREAYSHQVTGVAGKVTKVVGKLVGVPIHLGHPPASSTTITATFYILESPRYHWILGLHTLNAIDGVIFCSRRQLHYQPDPAGSTEVL
jgi:hypothetical protein